MSSSEGITAYTLWGSHPLYAGGTVIKLSGGTLNECHAQLSARVRESREWLTAIYAVGTAPAGLRLIAAERAGR